MSWIDDLFGGGRESAGRDMFNQMRQGLGSATGEMNNSGQFYDPYIQRGNSAYQDFINALNQGKNPQDLYNQFASGYKESPEALAQQQVGQKAANQANAASGMLGSGAAQTEAANLAQSVRSNDFDKYMGNMFGIRNQYLGGLGGIEGQGFQASQNDAQMRERYEELMQKYYEDMAKAKGAQDEGRSAGSSGLLGALGGIAGSLFGGPGGGLAGGGIGNWLDNLFGGGGSGYGGDPQQLPSDDPYSQYL